jgi:hypothetical protein
MNKIIKSKFRDREVVICYSITKDVIYYVLNTFGSKNGRVLISRVTTNRDLAKKFLSN